VSRYGRADTSFGPDRRDHSQPVDTELGTRRARAADLLTMALPGSVYVHQGEELGLWEVEDIPDERRQDPIWHRTGGADPGRDGQQHHDHREQRGRAAIESGLHLRTADGLSAPRRLLSCSTMTGRLPPRPGINESPRKLTTVWAKPKISRPLTAVKPTHNSV